jgi:hypothetical protein
MTKGGASPPQVEPIESSSIDPADLLKDLSLTEQRYLAGPIVQPRLNGWDFPDRLRAIVPAARILQLLHGQTDAIERDLASEEEALGYLSCASLDAPFDRDWAEIMGYLAQQVFPRWRFTEEAVHAVLGYARPIALNSTQAEDLRRLRRWLRHTIESGAKTKGVRKSQKTRPKPTTK